VAPIAAFEATNDAHTLFLCNPDWRSQNAYRCHVCIIREDDGSFSALVLNLPGTGSCGSTEEEALRNVTEAVCGVIASHRDAGEEIPWRDAASCDIPAGAKLKWILVNA
jgi:predicted RNase H-like HicB family nuclease